ncbi:bifunctional DNA-formamidopyrimidine glycosylase/DNA-(apurinic or apyrimidinic site) lyase [Candidatus Gracilibacteria bacterium]|nr:bifunctional DNA-formamidopyrimidine glycosylase/DNA-(apurinic or apyrimidinic site) lyase [Candidatus Gracilibacteria bacterium]
MPELPEVEIAARSLAPQVIGRSIVGIASMDWERMVETPDIQTFYALLPGQQITAVGRRAKWILISLASGLTLTVHLRMSGRLYVVTDERVVDKHTHLVLALDNGARIFFSDERKFGRVRLLDGDGLTALDHAHGPEPLSEGFTPAELARIMRTRRTPIKQLLLDQRAVAGLGNIYVSEALWMAQIHPLTPATLVAAAQIPALHAAIRAVLEQAIRHEGSTLRNYRNGYGQQGQNQEHFLVYGREGAPCSRCGTAVQRLVIGQRSSFYCGQCQPLS